MLKARTTLGKYRILRCIDKGGFACVFAASDKVEGIQVALKIPHAHFVDKQSLKMFHKEVRLTARLDHPNILAIKTATFIDGHFVIVYPLGQGNLADRLRSRMSLKTTLDYGEQLLEALAAAHEHNIVHCDVKPENMILFPGGIVRLADFGIAKVAFRTLRAAGTGTLGYLSPEQAMGRPSFRSDVFSMGLVLYRMLSGKLPEWPFEWPFAGHERLRSRVHPDLIALLQRATDLDPRRRFEDASRMLDAFQRVLPRALSHATRRSTIRRGSKTVKNGDWKNVRFRQFKREHGKELEARHSCQKCDGPLSESMLHCPWCGVARKTHKGAVRLPAQCPRCSRGMKLDWRFCPWCYGGLVGPLSDRAFSDARYVAACARPSCRKGLMPFMRYCPWCHEKVRKPWKIEGASKRCKKCNWSVLPEFWDFCPWCRHKVGSSTR